MIDSINQPSAPKYGILGSLCSPGVNPREGAAAPFLVVSRGIAKGESNQPKRKPAERLRFGEDQQRNGRDRPLAAGRGIWSLRGRAAFSFDCQRPFLCHAKKRGVNRPPRAQRADKVCKIDRKDMAAGGRRVRRTQKSVPLCGTKFVSLRGMTACLQKQ